MAPARRLFVGIFPPAELAEAVLEASARTLAGTDCRLVRAEEIHLTLRFLGATDEARIPELETAFAGALAGSSAPRLRIRGAGAFPDARRARVLWAGVEDEDAEGTAIRHLAESLGGGIEEESFRPHLTVARARSLRVPETFLELSLDLLWRPSEVRLVESRPGASGPGRFPSIATFPLS